MKTSESIKEIATALKNFQAVAKNAFKEKSGYNYKYAPIDVILKENRPLMATYGLSHIQSQSFIDGIVEITTRLMHESGEWIETSAQSPFAQMKGMNDYQSIGSGITYLRRYSLSAALGIAADEDEDAHGEQEQKPKLAPPSKASSEDKKKAWNDFKDICENLEVDAVEFMESNMDMSDKNAVYGEVRKWLNNIQLLRDQLLVYKNS
mgnify:CR=1 FL=1|jgi:hypothetical protein